MAYLLERTRLGFCWFDLIALIVLLVVIAVFVIKRHDIVSERKDLEDELSDLYAEDSMEQGTTANV